MINALKKLSPPGINLTSELQGYFIGVASAFLYSLTFFIRFISTLDNLYGYTHDRTRVLLDDAVMPYYAELLENSLNGFIFLAICSLVVILYHYFYFSQNGSRTLYTMKRLPDRTLLAKYCLTLPIIMAVTALVIAFILLLLYFGIYMLLTPNECIRAGQWARIWSF